MGLIIVLNSVFNLVTMFLVFYILMSYLKPKQVEKIRVLITFKSCLRDYTSDEESTRKLRYSIQNKLDSGVKIEIHHIPQIHDIVNVSSYSKEFSFSLEEISILKNFCIQVHSVENSKSGLILNLHSRY